LSAGSDQLNVRIGKLTLANPTVLAAGIMGSTASSLRRIMTCGAGGVVTKSVGLTPREGHPGPVLVETSSGFLNALGLPNAGLTFTDELEQLIAEAERKPLIVSIFGANADEFVELARTFCRFADALELNLSCPHARGYGIEVGAEPALVQSITRSVKKQVEPPVWVKLTPNVTDITEIGHAAEKGGADAVVAINTVKGMAIDVESGRPVLGNVFGGLSGSAIRPVAVKCVYDLYEALRIPIVGVGGVSSYEDALELIMAGAKAIQIGSAVARDLSIFKRVADGIDRFLARKGITLEDAVGSAHESH
jgi:dihydroorotate dehydrogenase (NAD+) catalytic subunit